MTDTAEQLKTRLREQIDILDDALFKIRNRELVALDRMEHTIAAICNDIQTGDPETARTMGPLMADMIARLEEMALALKDFQTTQDQRK